MRRMRARNLSMAMEVFSATIASPALGQRGDASAVRSAEDAFGTSIGRESIGIYNPFSVRGFSPVTAGNVRLGGLYFDAIVPPNNMLTTGNVVRVGISAQGYPFPAPTGIADFRLRTPASDSSGTVIVGGNTYGTVNGEANFNLPVGQKAGIAGAFYAAQDRFETGGRGNHFAGAVIAKYQPATNLEILPFWSILAHRDEPTSPVVAVQEGVTPPRIKRGVYFGQDWTVLEGEDVNYGILGRWNSGATSIATGIFRSLSQTDSSYTDVFTGTDVTGRSAGHHITAVPDQKFASTSGEVRVSRLIEEGPRRHLFQIAGWARAQDRRYGGAMSREFGAGQIGAPVALREPVFVFGQQSHDRIRQLTAGIAYQGQWEGLGELTLGIRKTDYEKRIERPGRAEPVARSHPWLYNAGFSLSLSGDVAIYGGYTTGLEEAGAAPDVALNRNEAPPAIDTKQWEAGVRWRITPDLRLVAGLFNVEKPYFSLDTAQLYRRLGDVKHRGLEMSLSGKVSPRLTLLAGGVLLKAIVRGEAVDAQLVGERAFNSLPLLISGGLDYRAPWVEGLSVDLNMVHSGRRVANTANTLFTPAYTSADVGLRYRRSWNGIPSTVRFQMTNITNNYRWLPVASNTLRYTGPRSASLRITFEL